MSLTRSSHKRKADCPHCHVSPRRLNCDSQSVVQSTAQLHGGGRPHEQVATKLSLPLAVVRAGTSPIGLRVIGVFLVVMAAACVLIRRTGHSWLWLLPLIP